MPHRILPLAALLLVACGNRPTRGDGHVTAAAALTARYAQSRLARWNVRAFAAGADCRVLLIETAIMMEDSMVEALHYGAGAHAVSDGGVQQFAREHAFRGVAYRDSSKRVWAFGELTAEQAAALAPCR